MATTRKKNVTGRATASQVATTGPKMAMSVRTIREPARAVDDTRKKTPHAQRQQTMMAHTLGNPPDMMRRRKK